MLILTMIALVVIDGVLRPGLRGGGLRRDPGRLRQQRAGRPAAVTGGRDAGGGVRGPVVGARRRARIIPAVHPHQQALPRLHELPQRLVPQARAARRAAGDGPGGRERHLRPARRSRIWAGRISSTGSPARSAGGARRPARPGNTGKSLNPKTFIMGIRDMAEDGRATIDIIPNSPIVRETYGLDDTTLSPAALARPIVDTAIPYDAVWDCVTCGACVEACPVLIEHVDKIVGAAAQPRPGGDSRFPERADAGVPGDGEPGQPVGPAVERPDGLDPEPLPFEVPVVADGRSGGRTGRARGPLLGRMRGRVRYPQPEGRPCCRYLPPRGRRAFRDSWPGGVVHRGPGASDGQRLRLPDPGDGQRGDARSIRMGERTIVTACPHCFNSIGNEYGQLGGDVQGRPPQSRTWRSSSRPGGCATLPEDAASTTGDHRPGDRHGPRLVLPGALQRCGRGASICAGSGRRDRSPRWSKSGKSTFCCGAGGGRMWMEETRGTRINAERTRQVLETGADDRGYLVSVLHGHDERRTGCVGRGSGSQDHGRQRDSGGPDRGRAGRSPAAGGQPGPGLKGLLSGWQPVIRSERDWQSTL